MRFIFQLLIINLIIFGTIPLGIALGITIDGGSVSEEVGKLIQVKLSDGIGVNDKLL